MPSRASDVGGDYFKQLRTRLVAQLKAEVFDESLATRVWDIYGAALSREPVVLTRREKEELLQASLREILDDLAAGV